MRSVRPIPSRSRCRRSCPGLRHMPCRPAACSLAQSLPRVDGGHGHSIGFRRSPVHRVHDPPESLTLRKTMNHGILVAFGAVILLASCEHDTAAPTALNRTTPPMAHDLTTVDPSAIPPQGPYEAINLGTLGGANGSARGINNNGAIIGIAQAPDRTTHPFLWQNHVMQALDSGRNGFTSAEAINDDGIIAGTGIVGGTTYAMTWINGTVLALGPVSPSTSVLLNQMGDVAWTGPTPSGPHAFLWHAGTIQDLGTLGGPSSQANGLNDAGQVMGFSR